MARRMQRARVANEPIRRLVAVVCLAAALTGFGWALASSAGASPIFAGTTPNVWILQSDGTVSAEYNVGASAWTTNAVLGFGMITVSHTGGPSVIGNVTGVTALVNLADNSDPPLPAALPSLSLVGLASELSNAGLPARPAVSLVPLPGSYDQTIKVTVKAISSPNAVGPLNAFYSVNTGPTNPAAGPEVSFFLVEADSYTIDYWSLDDGVSSVVEQAIIVISAADPLRDSDGDGVPDLVEAESGLDPLVNDLPQDSDGDGWTDFEEIARGSDPNDPFDTPTDSDGDGWSDFDEDARSTSPTDPNDHPSDVRRAEVEYLVTGNVWRDTAKTLPQADMAELTATSATWTEHFGQDDVDAAGLAALAIGDIPLMRVPGGDPVIVRARHLEMAEPDAWVAKAWIDSSPDVLPDGVTDYLDGMGTPWTSTAEWLLGYANYLRANLVKGRSVDLTPDSALGIHLLESAVAWYDDLSGEGPILLGNLVSPRPLNALHDLESALAPDRTLDSLHGEFVSQTGMGLPLEPFATSAIAYYADLESFSQSTTTRAVAALVQGATEDDDATAAYFARLLTQMSVAEIAALSPAEQALIIDPVLDLDGDGLANYDELKAPPTSSSHTDSSDTDNDGVPDDQDPCPMEEADSCLRVEYLVMDSDGDGYDDAVDNCMNDDNNQLDSNDDGIGDACLRTANIVRPVSNVRLYVGNSVFFSAIETELWFGGRMSYFWDFVGAAPNLTVRDPGDVTFAIPGDYTIEFLATEGGGSPLPADTRRIVVQGIGPLPTVDAGGPYFIGEGHSLQLTAAANSQNGAITDYDWSFGDSAVGSGNPINHVYTSQGFYNADVEITDVFFLKASDSVLVSVADSVPAADFDYQAVAGGIFDVDFSDQSTSYDGIASWFWDFGDGGSSPLQNPSHSFSSFSPQTVTLTVTDADGSVDVAVQKLAPAVPGLPVVGLGVLTLALGALGWLGARGATRRRC